MDVVDLRSDTVTRPTPGMRSAMAEAEVGDDVYGEDPTVNALEARVAGLLGHEAGLFVPTGSLGNQLGVRLLVPPGGELLCDRLAHVVRAELGAHAVLGGVTTRTWSAPRGRLDPGEVVSMAQPDAGPYLVSTAAIVVEDTHNFGGGTVQDMADLRILREWADASGVGLHLDGARIWNAHVASGVALAEIGGLFDTASVCLSKGLGAPVGSVLVSSAQRIAAARVWRKRYGAGMRQVGILAAAGLHALDHHVGRLAEDHARARRLAGAVAEVRPDLVDPVDVETNIVVLDLGDGPGAPELAGAARERGVAVSVLGPRTVRLVTHMDVDDDGIDHAIDVLRGLLLA
ncbi:MAG: beta-eliminating lyase-related protein [Candidatus Nanopelagicales bacterium]|jgi:threonine aldolase|nr:beta-eliminating lyase-related protein [Candidatus Nanopelagicales bacterium]